MNGLLPTVVLMQDEQGDNDRTLASIARSDVPAGLATVQGAAGTADVAAAWEQHGGDLIVLGPQSEVGRRWIDGLVGAARAVPGAATVSVLSNNAGILTVPRRNVPFQLSATGFTAERAAAIVDETARRLYPRVPVATPHAVLISASAIELVDGFDTELQWREALADFCVRATAAGLEHVVADDVYVGNRADPPAGPVAGWEGEAADRHRGLADAVREAAEDRHSALSQVLLSTAVALEPLSVTVDARSLVGGVSGTGVHVAELLVALSARQDLQVRALLPDQPGGAYAESLERAPRLQRITEGQIGESGRTHVAHRPWQVESLADVELLDRVGERVLITQQDLIGYRMSTVFASTEQWRDYRTLTAEALGLAAGTLFFSEVVAREAVAEGLVEDSRAHVVPLGAESGLFAGADEPRCPSGFQAPERFLLVIGNRFLHKNTVFALELLRELRDGHGWDGAIVLAGADVLHGSGTGLERKWMLDHPEHSSRVHDLGAIGQPEKAWLLQHAAGVVYPSVTEGFGLVPFEAAAAGLPCFFAPVSAMGELFPTEAATLVPWDAAASAERVAPALTDGSGGDQLIAAVRRVASSLTWDRTAELAEQAYRAAVQAPAPAAAKLTAELASAEHRYWQVRDQIPRHVWELVDPERPLLDEDLSGALASALGDGSLRARLGVLRRTGRRTQS